MSRALLLFEQQMERANALTDTDVLRGRTNAQRQVYYHAEIAARVAAWDAYLNQIIREALNRIGNPLDAEVFALKRVVLAHADTSLNKFNTPNFENSRNLLLSCTGFDPIASWNWPLRGMNWQLVNSRLNEVLKIRHSFAHGIPIPRYPWLPANAANVYLNRATVNEITRLLRHLAKQTDAGLDAYLRQNYTHLNPAIW